MRANSETKVSVISANTLIAEHKEIGAKMTADSESMVSSLVCLSAAFLPIS